MQSTHTYCEALLELMREGFARILNCGSNIIVVVANFPIANGLTDRNAVLEMSTSSFTVQILLARRIVYPLEHESFILAELFRNGAPESEQCPASP